MKIRSKYQYEKIGESDCCEADLMMPGVFLIGQPKLAICSKCWMAREVECVRIDRYEEDLEPLS